MASCEREDRQKANQTPQSAKQSLCEAVKGKFVCAGSVAYDHKDIFFLQTVLHENQMQAPECLCSQLTLKCWTVTNHDVPGRETLIESFWSQNLCFALGITQVLLKACSITLSDSQLRRMFGKTDVNLAKRTSWLHSIFVKGM